MFKPSPSKPIEDYALIGDGRTAALVARDGDIDWLCWPRFDSDACLSALLGDERHGAWRLRPTEGADVSRSYCGDTQVLQTEFRTSGGVLRLTDFMPLGEDDVSAVIRRLDVREGAVEVETALSLRFGYGEIAPWFSALSGPGIGGFSGEVGPDLVVLRGPGLWRDRDVLRARFTAPWGGARRLCLAACLFGAANSRPDRPGKGARPHAGIVAGLDRPLRPEDGLARRSEAFAPHAQSADAYAEREHRRGAHARPAGKAGRSDELGLPLLLAERLRLHPHCLAQCRIPRRSAGVAALVAAGRGRSAGQDAGHVSCRRRSAN